MNRKRRTKKRRRVTLAVLVILVLAWGGVWHYRSSPLDYIRVETDNPLISGETFLCAHRSGAGIFPEESRIAFRYCAELSGFRTDYFEFDLHLTKDDRLVLMHDDSLDRTTDSRTVFGRSGVTVRDVTLSELRQLNIGAGFVNDDGIMPYRRYAGDRVPDELRIFTLEEALDYLTGVDDYRYIIEIKDDGEAGMKAADILYAELKERDMLGVTEICSFHDDVLRYVDERYPDAIRGAGIAETLEFVIAATTNDKDYVPRCDAVQLPYGNPLSSAGLNLGLISIVNYAHEHDIAVQYWTINDTDDMKYLKSLHVDVIMTDYPGRLAEVL